MADNDKIPEGLISQTESFDVKTPLSKIIRSIQEYEAVIINKNEVYFGIVDSREIYRYMQGLKVSKGHAAEKFVVRVPRITDSTSLDDVIYYFNKSRTKALPYVKNDKLRGILKRSTLIKMLLSLKRLEGVRVEEAMTTPLIAVDLKSSVSQARSVMRDNKINRLAVFDGEHLVGILTNYDLVDKMMKPKERLPELKSVSYTPSNIMLTDVIQRNFKRIDQARGLSDAARELVENDISSIIVTKGNKPTGILTELDIITSALAKGGIEANRVYVSGLDADTYQYEDEIKESLKSFMTRMEKLNKIKVEYINIVVKKFKTNSYEIYARVSLGNNGVLNSHIVGHLFERTLNELLAGLDHEIKKQKEIYLSVRRIKHNEHAEEE